VVALLELPTQAAAAVVALLKAVVLVAVVQELSLSVI
jgi:hypothetical protein